MLVDTDFKNLVSCEYNTKRNCRENGCDDGVCHCSTIHNITISHVDISSIVDTIYNIYFDDSKSSKRNSVISSVLYGIDKQIDLYTIDRILRSHKIWLNEVYDIEVVNGYYGQEIGTIHLEEKITKKIEHDIDKSLSINDLSERIEYILGIEYGYLLSDLVGCRYELADVTHDDITFGSIDHYKKMKKLEYYNDHNYNNIRGVVIEKNGKYRLIDGYHRVFSTNRNLVKVLKAIKKTNH